MKSVLLLILLTSGSLVFAQKKTCSQLSMDGDFHLSEKRYKLSLKSYQAALNCDPSISNYFGASTAAAKTGMIKQSFAYLKKAILLGGSLEYKETITESLSKFPEWKNVELWQEEVKTNLSKELSNLGAMCPARHAVPYLEKGKWGYVDSASLKPLTKAIFGHTSFVGLTGNAQYGDYSVTFNCSGKITDYQLIEPRIIGIDDRQITEYSVSNPLSGEIQLLTLSTANGQSELTNALGENVLGGIKFKKISLLNLGRDSYDDYADKDGLFFFICEIDKNQYILFDSYLKQVPDLALTDFRIPKMQIPGEITSVIRQYPFFKVGNSWGVWNASEKRWQVKPEYDFIFFNESYQPDYYDRRPIAVYFWVEKNKRSFYIDLSNRKYLPVKQ